MKPQRTSMSAQWPGLFTHSIFSSLLLTGYLLLRETEFKVKFQGSVLLITCLVFQGYRSYGSLLSQGLRGTSLIVSEMMVRE